MKQSEKPKDNMLELIKQPYPVTMAIHRFTLQEERILARVFEALQPQINELRHISDDGTHVRYYTPSEVGKTNLGDTYINIPVKLLALDSKNHFEVKKALKMLTKRSITVCNRNDKGEMIDEVFTNVFMEAKFPKNAQKAKIKISQELMPQFLAQARLMASGKPKDNYTRLQPATFFKTSSKHVINMYKYISHFRDKKIVYCTLDSFKKFMNIEGAYAMPSAIKQQIITPAIKELKKKSDVWFDIAERVMDGRKFVGWKFNIYTRTKKAVPSKFTQTNTPTSPPPSHIEKMNNMDLEERKRLLLEEIEAVELQKKQNVHNGYTAMLVAELKLSEKQAEGVAFWMIENANFREFINKLRGDISRGNFANIGGFAVTQLRYWIKNNPSSKITLKSLGLNFDKK